MLGDVSSLSLPDTAPHDEPRVDVTDIEALAELLSGRRVVALTGAGCSTESGIPDYRGNGRPAPKHPIQHDAFIRNQPVRRRYWARATLGWQRFSRAQPNAGHHAPPAPSRGQPPHRRAARRAGRRNLPRL